MTLRLIALIWLLGLPLTVAAADVSGMWVGYYAYDTGQGGTRVECAMVLQTIDGAVGGTMIERQTFGDGVFPGYPANLSGKVENGSIRFSKHYVADDDNATPVSYQLNLSPDGSLMTGFWTVNQLQGTAYFRRVTADSAGRIPAP